MSVKSKMLKINTNFDTNFDEKKTNSDIQETITEINKLIVEDIKHSAPKLDVKVKHIDTKTFESKEKINFETLKYNSEKHDSIVSQLMVIYPYISYDKIKYAVVQSDGNETRMHDYLDNCIINYTTLIPKIQLFDTLPKSIMKAYTQITHKLLKVNYENLVTAITKICEINDPMIDVFLDYQKSSSFEHSEQLIANKHVTNTIDLALSKLKTELEYCKSAINMHEVLGIGYDESLKRLLQYQNSTIAINQDCIKIFET
jgi:hypothetical protein